MKLRKVALSIGWLLVGGCEFHASCGGGRTLNMSNAEALVRSSIATQTGIEPKVTCPERVKVEKGARFDCEVVLDDVHAVATLEQKDDKTNVEVVSISGFLVSTKLAQVIGEKLQAQSGRVVKVDCGPRVRPSTPGDTFRCHAADDAGTTLDVEVKVKDAIGNVSYDVVAGSVRTATPPAEAPAPAAPPIGEQPEGAGSAE